MEKKRSKFFLCSYAWLYLIYFSVLHSEFSGLRFPLGRGHGHSPYAFRKSSKVDSQTFAWTFWMFRIENAHCLLLSPSTSRPLSLLSYLNPPGKFANQVASAPFYRCSIEARRALSTSPRSHGGWVKWPGLTLGPLISAPMSLGTVLRCGHLCLVIWLTVVRS